MEIILEARYALNQKKIKFTEIYELQNEELDSIRFTLNSKSEKRIIFDLVKQIYRVLKPEGSLIISYTDIFFNQERGELAPIELFEAELLDWKQNVITLSWLKKCLNIAGFLILKQKGSTIIEAKKESSRLTDMLPLVSIVIPAYKSEYFEESLISAMGQDYLNKEIVVADEGVDKDIFQIVQYYKARFPKINLRYFKHQYPLGEIKNFEFCRNVAKGKYLKYLNDDDILDPECVKTYVSYFEAFSNSVTLISSIRLPIDRQNNRITCNAPAYDPLFKSNTYAFGKEIIKQNLNFGLNQIGEPTVVMFRKTDTDENLTKFKSELYECTYDMVLNFKLLLKGNFLYISRPLSFFRVHESQASREEEALLHAASTWCNMVLAAKYHWNIFDDLSEYKMALITVKKIIFGISSKVSGSNIFKLENYLKKIFQELTQLDKDIQEKFVRIKHFFELNFDQLS